MNGGLTMQAKIAGALVAATLIAVAGGAVANAAAGDGGSVTAASRLDDGMQFATRATISEQQAIAAAQARASGSLNEVDLEQADGRLVFNVDVGAHDVTVDAATGRVMSVDADD